jgi:N-acetylated-alpha-linked acidic dipeptidase
LPILQALNGHGPAAKSLGDRWAGSGLAYKGVEYSIGPTPDGLRLNLYNEQEYVITPIWNVIGVINGTFPDEVVIVGNHRDAWIAGGAGDPNSGSAALNEVIRSFGVALKAGWKPVRTIVFASWDGEEYGLVGSTEWVEEYLPWLNATAVAYINVDTAASGPHFSVKSSPLLDGVLVEATKLVQSANQTAPGQTIYDVWDKRIATMGSGSDFTAFQDYAGIPSVSLGFGPQKNSAVYHYHSIYDSFDWMQKFGDPGFHYHIAAARVLGVLTAKIAETSVVPLNVTDYADALHRYLNDVKARLANSTKLEAGPSLLAPLDGLQLAVARLRNSTVAFDEAAAELAREIAESPIPWWRWWDRLRQAQQLRDINTRYKLFERRFLYAKGLDGRPWFKHVVFAPGLWTGYAGATFPGLIEAVDAGDVSALYRWANVVLALVERARASLAV